MGFYGGRKTGVPGEKPLEHGREPGHRDREPNPGHSQIVHAKTNCYSIKRADPGETLSLSRLVSYAFCNFGHFVLLA